MGTNIVVIKDTNPNGLGIILFMLAVVYLIYVLISNEHAKEDLERIRSFMSGMGAWQEEHLRRKREFLKRSGELEIDNEVKKYDDSEE